MLFSQRINSQVDSVYTGEPKKNSTRADNKGDGFLKFKEKLTYGGMIMPGFGADSYGSVFYLVATPNIGYRVTDELTVGIEGNYTYTSMKTRYGIYKESVYGPGAFARYKIFNSGFLQLQYNKLNQPNYYTGYDKRIWLDYVYAGGGYFQRITDRSGFLTSVLFNLTPSVNSIYRTPVFQVGFITSF